MHPTVDELEKILNSEDPSPCEIMPDGSIIRVTPEMIAVGAKVHRDDDCQSDEEIAIKIYFAMEKTRRVIG